jgi:hypothetical protein
MVSIPIIIFRIAANDIDILISISFAAMLAPSRQKPDRIALSTHAIHHIKSTGECPVGPPRNNAHHGCRLAAYAEHAE